MICIYQIRNLLNNKKYIGSAVNFYTRKCVHISDLRGGKHHSNHLQNSWNKYGEKNFVFEILEETTLDNLISLEQKYIDSLNTTSRSAGYNIAPTAGNMLGFKHSDKTKEKLRNIQMGKSYVDKVGVERAKEWIEKARKSNTGKKRSYDVKMKFSGENNPMFGKTHTDEVRQRMSDTAKGRTPHNKGKAVCKYTLNGTLVENATLDMFPRSMKPNIVKCCQGERRSAFGYIWKYE